MKLKKTWIFQLPLERFLRMIDLDEKPFPSTDFKTVTDACVLFMSVKGDMHSTRRGMFEFSIKSFTRGWVLSVTTCLWIGARVSEFEQGIFSNNQSMAFWFCSEMKGLILSYWKRIGVLVSHVTSLEIVRIRDICVNKRKQPSEISYS